MELLTYGFETADRPGELAQSLRVATAAAGLLVSEERSLDLLAMMAGYEDWGDLSVNGLGRPTVMDSDLGIEDVRARRHRQVTTLMAQGLTEASASLIAGDLGIGHDGFSQFMDWQWQPMGGHAIAEADFAVYVSPPVPDVGYDIGTLIGGSPEPSEGEGKWSILVGTVQNEVFRSVRAPLRFADSEQEARDLAAGLMRDHLVQMRDVVRTGRREIDMDPLRGIDSRWGEIEGATDYGRHVWKVWTARHGGFRVPEGLMEEIQPLYRQRPSGDGYCYYEQDCEWAIFALGMPDLFTEAELKRADGIVEMYFEDIHDLHVSKEPPAPEQVKRAHRGFSEDSFQFSTHKIGPVMADGKRVVLAHLTSVWSSRHFNDEDLRRPYFFLVEEDGYRVDPDIHPMVGLTKPVADIEIASPDDIVYAVVPFEVHASSDERTPTFLRQFYVFKRGNVSLQAFFADDGPTIGVMYRNSDVLGYAVLGDGCALHSEGGAWVLRSGDEETVLPGLDDEAVADLVKHYGIGVGDWRPEGGVEASEFWPDFLRFMSQHDSLAHEDVDASGLVARYNALGTPLPSGGRIVEFRQRGELEIEEIRSAIADYRLQNSAPRP